MWNETDIGDASAFRILTMRMPSIHISQDLMHFSDFISQSFKAEHTVFLPWIVMEEYLKIE